VIALLAPLLLSLGIPARFHKAALIGAAVVAVIAGFLIWLAVHDRGVVHRHDQEREAAAGEARETAADERVTDAVTNAKNEEDLHNAIDDAPKGGELSPAAHALACERLRKLGRIPAACGHQSGDGSEAGPR